MSEKTQNQPSNEDLMAQIAALQAENDGLKATKTTGRASGVSAIKTGQKGGMSVYGLGRFPVNLYLSQAASFFESTGKILDYCIAKGQEDAGTGRLAVKEDEDRVALLARVTAMREHWGNGPTVVEVSDADDIAKV